MGENAKTKSATQSVHNNPAAFLVGSSKMSTLIAAYNWESTRLKSITKWPQSLKTALNLILLSPIPMVILWGKDGIVLYNDAYGTFAGKKHPSILGMKAELAWPDIADFNKNVIYSCLSGKTLVYNNQRLSKYQKQVKNEVWMNLHYSPIIAENDKPAGLLTIIIDVTREILANENRELALESEQQFRFMVETLPLKIFTATPEGKITYFNEQWTEYTGVPMDVLRRDGVQRFLHPDDLAISMDTWHKALNNGGSVQNEQRLRNHKGHYRRHISYARAMRDDTGKIISWFGFMTDIEDALEAVIQNEKLELITIGLKEQRAQLLAINTTKDEFIALSSHQLRTPATAVKQYIGLILNDFFGPINEEQRASLQTAYDSNERQLNIISDLLKTAQLDSSRYALVKQKKAIAEILNEAIIDLRITLAMKNQKIIFEDNNVSTKLLVDAHELKLAFINLLENAAKYSYEKSTINISMKKIGAFLEITFKDSGVGIDPLYAKRIFDKFTRVDNELSDTVNGTGLGLYLVKRIIKLHHGMITVDSALGEGSTFTIRLPI